MNSLLPLLLVSLTIVPALISFALPDRLAVWRDARAAILAISGWI